jgi:hypothetical protein
MVGKCRGVYLCTVRPIPPCGVIRPSDRFLVHIGYISCVIWEASYLDKVVRSPRSMSLPLIDTQFRRGFSQSFNSTLSHRGGIATITFMSVLSFFLVPWQVAFLACYFIHLHQCAILLCLIPDTREQQNMCNQKLLLLFIMTWCLPIVMPVLAVWVRTMMTAGLTTPFDGDHVVLNALSFMAIIYVMTTSSAPFFARRHR